MPLVTTASLVNPKHQRGYGIAAFNVITLEHAEAITLGAERSGHPAILQLSENAVRFHHGRLGPLAAAVTAVAEAADVPIAVHLDHVKDEVLMRAVPGTGISSVMFDASELDDDANMAATRDAADWAHANGLWIEAELGEIGGKGGAHTPGVRTDPDDAVHFVKVTGVDALAVAVGSSHAMTSRTAAIDLTLVRTLSQRLPVPLVLHGSSGVPDVILAAAVALGMTKVNIGTILNVAFTGAVREVLATDEALVDPRTYLAPAREAVATEVARLADVVGQGESH